MCSWWKWWRWPEMNKEILPMNGTGGVMIYKDNTPIAAGFLYLTNSKAAWLDWVVSNPSYKESDRKEAIKLLISTLEEIGKKQGYNVIISLTRNKSLINIHKELDYTVDENPSYEISKKIN
jgi:hypothetical protein